MVQVSQWFRGEDVSSFVEHHEGGSADKGPQRKNNKISQAFLKKKISLLETVARTGFV